MVVTEVALRLMLPTLKTVRLWREVLPRAAPKVTVAAESIVSGKAPFMVPPNVIAPLASGGAESEVLAPRTTRSR
jgi:hypothetical protein